MPEIIWNSSGSGTFPGIIEKQLIRDNILSKEKGILDHEKFINFGIFSLLLWFLPYKREYYFDPKKNKFQGSYFNFYVTGIDDEDKTVFLLSTEKDKFVYPHRNIAISDPLNYLLNGDKNHAECPIFHLITYNLSYVKNMGIDMELPEIEDGCFDHKKIIRKWSIEDEISASIYGGWPLTLDVNPELLKGLEFQEKNNRDAIFNEFLSIYFKYKLNADSCYSNAELESPFKSHEVDACFIKNNNLIMLETSAEFDISDENIKKKIYNLWSIEKIYDEGASFYLTFGDFKSPSHLTSFLKCGSDNNSPHFELLNFPQCLKRIEDYLKDINSIEDLLNFQSEIFDEFESFLNDLEDRISKFLPDS